MRELDDLLLAYLENCYPAASEVDKRAFHALLQLPDPELAGYLLQQQDPSAEMQRVVDQILGRADS